MSLRESRDASSDNCQKNFSEFEDQLVTLCQRLTCEDWTTGEGISGDLGTSLLHLAAALGLTRLTCSLLHWVAEKPGRRLCREVDPLSQDTEGFTPLVRERNFLVGCSDQISGERFSSNHIIAGV